MVPFSQTRRQTPHVTEVYPLSKGASFRGNSRLSTLASVRTQGRMCTCGEMVNIFFPRSLWTRGDNFSNEHKGTA